MRVVIKGADFENVSIGKVVKDLSFSFSITNENVSDYLLNPPTVSLTNSILGAANTNNNGTIIYIGTSSDASITASPNNPNRWVSDFIPVVAGMTIDLSTWYRGGETTPIIICFDSDKNIMNQPNGAWGSVGSYVIPSGCAYIKLQSQQMKLGQGASGTMPA